jgi:hypothetical protein
MSETPDEEVDYGSSGSIANPLTDSDHAWSTSEIEIFFYIVCFKTLILNQLLFQFQP